MHNDGDPIISLYQFAPINGKNFSPYCLKVEIYLQLANIPYKTIAALPNKAPLKKLPFIQDKGKLIPDSTLIIEYLKKTYNDPLDKELSEQQLAQGHLLSRVCEESLIYVLLYSRWIDEKQWPLLKQMVFSSLPPVIRSLIPALLRKKIRSKLTHQGYIQHSPEQIYAFGASDLKAIAAYLATTSFSVCNTPTSFDATLYAFLSTILDKSFETPLQKALLKHPCLVNYCERMESILKQKKHSYS